MEFEQDARIRWECNNWYKNEDNLLQICTSDGATVILNQIYSLIWENINYEIKIYELWEKVKNNNLEWKQFLEVINSLLEIEIVRVIEDKSEFDLIFG